MCGRPPDRGRDRGLSPVVGTGLLLAIVVLLVGVSATMIFGLADTQSPAPTVALSLEPTGVPGEYEIAHQQGDDLDGDKVVLRGVVDSEALAGREFAAGKAVTVDPYEETVTVVWFAEDRPDADSYVLSELDVTDVRASAAPTGPTGSIGGLGGTVLTGDGDAILSIEGDGGEVDRIDVSGRVNALGPAAVDVTGDGDLDVPFVTNGGELKLTDVDGNEQTLASDDNVSAGLQGDKTRLATGSWNGSDTSAFFVDDNNDWIYRVAPGGSPVEVAAPGDGAQAVIGIRDIDGDGTDELVFADASQHVRYLEPDGTVVEVTNAGAGSNNGIGTATLADLNGDGTPALVVVDGSNDLQIIREASGGGTTTITLGDAAKSPPTLADVDGDGELEAVYVSTDTDSEFKYVDDLEGANTEKVLEDDATDPIEGDDETGAV